MKKALLFIAVVTCFTSCKKDKQTKATSTEDLFGTWELAYIHGNFTPQPVANTGDMYRFGRDSTYTRYVGNKITTTGKFHIKITERRDTLEFGTIYFTNPADSTAWARTPHTFTLGTSIADGPSYEYHKTKN